MGKRILSTVLLWTLILTCIHFLGALGAVGLIVVVSVLTQREFYGMVARMGPDPFDRFGLLLGALITLAPLAPPSFAGVAEPSLILGFAVVAFSLRILGEREPHNRVETLAWTLFGLVYVPFMLHFLVRIVLLPGPHAVTGLALAVWLIAVSKFCDVGALLAGLAFGRHHMSPAISPKKTWEGAAGGLVASALVGAGIVYFFPDYMPARFTPALAAALAVPLAALAIVSDLVESIIKRRAGTKDAGQTIPGIGGVFDLSDSLILTSPVAFLVFRLL